MNTILKTAEAAVEIKALGAEVISFRRTDTGCEYIWSGDAQYWTGRSPVLFPIVGGVHDGEIKVDGASYKLGNHGFARHAEFELFSVTETQAVYRLSYDEKTLAVYPYKFQLYITYTLTGHTLEVSYKVDNADEQDIFFQLGTHPAFNCPIDENGSLQDYYLEFEHKETLERFYVNPANQLISGKSDTVLEDHNLLPLSPELFEEGAMIFREVKSQQVALKSKQTEKSVVVSYRNFPYLGIWQPKNAPFLCIEPWHGIADEDIFSGEFHEKEQIVRLAPGESFESALTIQVN